MNFVAQCLLQTLKNTSKSIRWLLLNMRDNDQVTSPFLSFLRCTIRGLNRSVKSETIVKSLMRIYTKVYAGFTSVQNVVIYSYKMAYCDHTIVRGLTLPKSGGELWTMHRHC